MNKYLAEYLDMRCVVSVSLFKRKNGKVQELKRLEYTNCISRTSNAFVIMHKCTYTHVQHSAGINYLQNNLKPARAHLTNVRWIIR